MRKKNRNQFIEKLEITKMAAEGRAIGYSDGKIIFVDYAIPGDIVDVQTSKNKKDFAIASVSRVVQASPLRQTPICQHFGTCGGCRWQHISYETQSMYKHQIVAEAFQKIGHLQYPDIQAIAKAPNIFHYRNKMEYTFSDRGWLTQEEIDTGRNIDRRALGFHVPGRFDSIIHIQKCHLQNDTGNQIRNFIYQYAIENNFSFYNLKDHVGLMRNLIMRNNLEGQWMITLSFGEDDNEKILALLDTLVDQFSQITSLNYVINLKKNDTITDLEVVNYYGVPYITEKLGDIKYKISPTSFFQTNSRQGKNLYDIVLKMATIDSEDTIYDLYTGTGSIALYLSQKAKKVVGIETLEAAINDAKDNQELNQITNTTFIVSPVENILDDAFIRQYGKPEVVITDPPRAGMHSKVIEVLLSSAPRQIIYVSCNPATQARDLQALSEKYEILEVQPVDMFPQTYHIENVVNLRLKSSISLSKEPSA